MNENLPGNQVANGHGGYRPGSGRKPSKATAAIREIVNNPKCIENALKFAEESPAFWFQLYQQIHGKPAQAVALSGSIDHGVTHQVELPGGHTLASCATQLPDSRPN